MILITNDDGIEAPGLQALREIGEALGDEVWVCAPETNHSGAGHSLSLNEPVRMRQIAERAYAVRGTPTDSVIMGLHHVLKGRTPDLILSGINRGSNVAEDVTYSGTIAACFEGTLLGIRSIALSQAISPESKSAPRWHTPITHAPAIIRSLIVREWAPSTLLQPQLSRPRARPGRRRRRHRAGPPRRRPPEPRRAPRHLGQSLLLARLSPEPLTGAREHRSMGDCQWPHLGDAALLELTHRRLAGGDRTALAAKLGLTAFARNRSSYLDHAHARHRADQNRPFSPTFRSL